MSIKITRKQKEYIDKYIDNLDELLEEDDITEVLYAIDDAIISTAEVCNNLQRIYDDLSLENSFF